MTTPQDEPQGPVRETSETLARKIAEADYPNGVVNLSRDEIFFARRNAIKRSLPLILDHDRERDAASPHKVLYQVCVKNRDEIATQLIEVAAALREREQEVAQAKDAARFAREAMDDLAEGIGKALGYTGKPDGDALIERARAALTHLSTLLALPRLPSGQVATGNAEEYAKAWREAEEFVAGRK